MHGEKHKGFISVKVIKAAPLSGKTGKLIILQLYLCLPSSLENQAYNISYICTLVKHLQCEGNITSKWHGIYKLSIDLVFKLVEGGKVILKGGETEAWVPKLENG